MARLCGYRLLRFIAVCAVVALISLVILPSHWSSTPESIPWIAAPGPASQADQLEEKLIHIVPSGDSGRLEVPVSEILMPGLVPPDVHFIWCGERWFEFKNYLSVMSVRRAMQPDKIYIHYERTPPLDRVYYHQVLYFVTYVFGPGNGSPMAANVVLVVVGVLVVVAY